MTKAIDTADESDNVENISGRSTPEQPSKRQNSSNTSGPSLAKQQAKRSRGRPPEGKPSCVEAGTKRSAVSKKAKSKPKHLSKAKAAVDLDYDGFNEVDEDKDEEEDNASAVADDGVGRYRENDRRRRREREEKDENTAPESSNPRRPSARSMRLLLSDYHFNNLGQEQQRVLDSPRLCEEISRGTYRVVKDKFSNKTWKLEPKDFPTLIPNDNWTADDDDELLDRWKITDELILRATSESELSVWRKARHLFDVDAADILKDPIYFKGIDAVKVKYRDETYHVEQKHWGQEGYAGPL